MSHQWYALHVKPHKERFVYKQLRADDIDAYLPLVKVNPVNPRAAKERPWFPGYLFVHIDLEEEGKNRLAWIPGSHRLVGFGEDPIPVPNSIIDAMQKELADIEKAGGLQVRGLEQGDKVRITSGPFAGYEGIFDHRLAGKDRVVILLTFLNDQHRKMQLDLSFIEKAKS